jgi:hypothetical protein
MLNYAIICKRLRNSELNHILIRYNFIRTSTFQIRRSHTPKVLVHDLWTTGSQRNRMPCDKLFNRITSTVIKYWWVLLQKNCVYLVIFSYSTRDNLHKMCRSADNGWWQAGQGSIEVSSCSENNTRNTKVTLEDYSEDNTDINLPDQ